MFEVLLVMTRSYDEWKKNIVTYVHAQVSYPTKLGCSILKRFLDLVETEKEQTEVINENKLLYFLNIFLSYIIVGLAN